MDEKVITIFLYDKDYCFFIQKLSFKLKEDKDKTDEENYENTIKLINRCVNWQPYTLISPNKSLMKLIENGDMTVLFDKTLQKWVKRNDLKIKYIKNEISGLIKNSLFSNNIEFKNRNIDVGISKFNDYLKQFVLTKFGIQSYPVVINDINDKEIIIENETEFKELLKTINDVILKMNNLSNRIKNGGTFEGIELKSLSEFTQKEIDSFDAEETVEQLKELSGL